jgi:ribonuclease HI
MVRIEIYTDGSCNQAKKIGGWAFVILEDGELKYKSSKILQDTTNNQCEMLAAINACEFLDSREFFEEPHITVYSDSAYMVNAFIKDWISNWLNNGWKTSLKEPVLNKELWESLIFFQKKYSINFEHIKRRSNRFSKLVDDMAKNS